MKWQDYALILVVLLNAVNVWLARKRTKLQEKMYADDEVS